MSDSACFGYTVRNDIIPGLYNGQIAISSAALAWRCFCFLYLFSSISTYGLMKVGASQTLCGMRYAFHFHRTSWRCYVCVFGDGTPGSAVRGGDGCTATRFLVQFQPGLTNPSIPMRSVNRLWTRLIRTKLCFLHPLATASHCKDQIRVEFLPRYLCEAKCLAQKGLD